MTIDMRSLKRYFYTLRRTVSRRWLVEVGVAAVVLLMVGLLVSVVFPYAPPKDSFYYGDTTNSTTLYRAMVDEVSDRTLDATLSDGIYRGVKVSVEYDAEKSTPLTPGTTILLSSSASQDSLVYFDRYRLPALVILLALFVAVVLLIGRRKGLRSLVGLFASILIIMFVLLPLVLQGVDAFWASILSVSVIALVTVIITQGFTRRAGVMLASIGGALLFIALGSLAAASAVGITGGLDELSYVITALNAEISLVGLVTGGILIAALGALDDIVTTQTATVVELRKADGSLSDGELFKIASRVGAEHIASIVNTLALVYVGAALPLLVVNAMGSPDSLYLLNSEFVAIEVVRILIISIGLVLAVPLTTVLAMKLLKQN